MHKFFYSSFILIYTIFQIIGCRKTCEQETYFFSLDETFSPESDSIRIGDTLWVASNHSSTFFDTLTQKNIDFSNAKLGLNIRLMNFTDSSLLFSGNIGAFPLFTTIVERGTETGNDNLPDENKGVQYAESDHQYSLKVAFIPKQKGIYGISLGDGLAVRVNKGCVSAKLAITNKNTNNHIYYYQLIRPDYEISSYEQTHLYCFKVY